MVEVSDIKNDRTGPDGWEKRSILDEPRLSEAVHLYEEMGFEVMVQTVHPRDVEDDSCCTTCVSGSMKVIYTRKRSHMN